MLDFFEIRTERRLHPVLYRAALGGFAFARLWEGATLRGAGRGRAFEAALYTLCERDHLCLNERAGSRTLCGTISASGLRHESDGVIGCADLILHVETKHLTEEVSKNDLMIFNQKGLDFVLTGDPRLRTRPLYRMFLSGRPLSREARRFSVLWGIITIEPDLMPLPILHWLAGSTFANGPQEQETADRIWREIPVLAAPLQERIRRLPACLAAVEHAVSPARIEWALDELQGDLGDRWWRDLDGRDPFWLERVHTDCMRPPSAAAKGQADA
jgi:hypothetical protein